MYRDAPLKELEYKKILSFVDIYNGRISQPKILEALAVNHDIYIDRGKLQYMCRVMKYKLLRVNKKPGAKRKQSVSIDYSMSEMSWLLLSNQWNRNLSL